MGAFIVIAGGGTGGHVFPGLAIAQELVRRDPSRSVLFIGSRRGLETRLVPAAGFPLRALELGGLAGMSLRARLVASTRAGIAVIRCAAWFLARRPALVVGVGGFASGPAVLAALILRVPTLIQEQNAVPGLTNRWLGRWVDRVAVSFPEPRRGSAAAPDSNASDTSDDSTASNASKTSRASGTPPPPTSSTAARGQGAQGPVVTGNPIRPEFFTIPAYQGPGERLNILVFGGSRGARTLNRAAIEAIPLLSDLKDTIAITLQTGEAQSARAAAAFAASPLRADVRAFLDDMPARLEHADLVICRSGAGTVFELAAAGRASVLVPFPHAAGDHQTANARWMEAAGACLVVPDAELTGARFDRIVRETLADPAVLISRARAARSLARPNAATEIAALAEDAMREARA